MIITSCAILKLALCVCSSTLLYSSWHLHAFLGYGSRIGCYDANDRTLYAVINRIWWLWVQYVSTPTSLFWVPIYSLSHRLLRNLSSFEERLVPVLINGKFPAALERAGRHTSSAEERKSQRLLSLRALPRNCEDERCLYALLWLFISADAFVYYWVALEILICYL